MDGQAGQDPAQPVQWTPKAVLTGRNTSAKSQSREPRRWRGLVAPTTSASGHDLRTWASGIEALALAIVLDGRRIGGSTG